LFFFFLLRTASGIFFCGQLVDLREVSVSDVDLIMRLVEVSVPEGEQHMQYWWENFGRKCGFGGRRR
jgi:hypothetical protein